MKIVKYIIRKILTPEGAKIEYDIVGKKASIIKLCREGRLKRRKCRKYVLGGGISNG